jgi:hypothetical protein
MVFSAELGWPRARGQPRVLSADRELAAQDLDSENPDPTLWRRLAAAIDFNRWNQPSPGVDLCKSPLVRHLPGLVSKDVCQWMIEHARGRLTRALVYDAVEKDTANETRTNTLALFNITNCDLVSVLIQVQICANTGVTFRQLEPLSVLHYDVGQQIIEHFDFVDPEAPEGFDQEVDKYGQRILTYLLYLNEDYTGGETELPVIGIAHKGTLGGGFFFVNVRDNGEPDLRTLHAGRPPTSGEKWVVSQWVRSGFLF